MSHTNLEHLQQLVLSDPALQKRFAALADRSDLYPQLLEQAQQHGYNVSADELRTAEHTDRSARPWRQGAIASGSWMPIALNWEAGQPILDWCHRGAARFCEPFFDQTISKHLSTPFNRLFRHRTPLDALAEYAETRPGVTPTGLIFHMSRCGSTLIAQMLAALPQTIVLAEAEPIDAVLRAHIHNPAVTDDQRIQWLRSVVSALSQPQNGETSCVIKFDCWNTMDMPLIQRAFPAARCVFVYRDPVEVLASHQRQRGRQMIPGLVEPQLFGLDATSASQIPLEEYGTRALAYICEAAVRYAQFGICRPINYRQLPDAVWELLELFQIAYTSSDLERMRDVTQFHAKNPSFYFTADAAAKQQEATKLVRDLAHRWLVPLYKQLEALE
jgi:gluconate kinase